MRLIALAAAALVFGRERYEYAADITGDADQRWTAVATSSFEPLSATITFGRDTTPRFSLTYRAGRVTGFVARNGARRQVNTIVPSGFDQRIDRAAVMASDLSLGRELHFSVYDPSLGVSPVIVTVGAVQRLTVPAGIFDVYPITYRIATRTIPRMMVREVFPDSISTRPGPRAWRPPPAPASGDAARWARPS